MLLILLLGILLVIPVYGSTNEFAAKRSSEGTCEWPISSSPPSKEEIEARGKLLGSTCEDVFQGYLEINNGPRYQVPPREVPANHWNEFSLFGTLRIEELYSNNMDNSTIIWENFDAFGWPVPATGATASMFAAMGNYSALIKGEAGLVFGDNLPWAEQSAFQNGAARVITVSDRVTEATTQMNWTWSHFERLSENWQSFKGQFRFVVSNFVPEHAGLGRYDGKLDPYGDLRFMSMVHCLLPPKGRLFIRLHIGPDRLLWNAHRVFGSARLPLLLQNFRIIAGFWDTGANIEKTSGIPVEQLLREEETHSTLVLEKI